LALEKKFLLQYLGVLKKYAPGAKIIIGGPYATIHYEDALLNNPIDCAVIGEGENVILQLITRFIENKDIRDIKGIAYRNGESIVINQREEYIESLDSIPFPDYRLIDIKQYWGYHQQMNIILAEKKYAPIITSRACPYQCIYCHNMFGKRVRKRSPENVVNEIKMLYHDYDVKEFHIIDDVFNVDRSRMREILNALIASEMKIKIAFPNGLRGDILEKEDLFLLKRAGAYSITLAIETASERMQRLIKKNLNIKKVFDIIDYANEIGIITRGFFMLGFPGESVEEMHKTVAAALHSKLDFASFSSVVPFKGTELYDLAKETYKDKNIKIDDFVSYNEKSLYEEATGYKVSELQKRAYLRFYSPKRVISLFFKIPRKTYLLFQFMSLGFGVCRS
jgi:radical SAM superfamily enzyme YgiQ (UPF0313 family)